METNVPEDAENKNEFSRDIEQEYKFIEQAHDDFKKGNYDKCRETLDELEKCCGSNSKLLHNRAIAGFYQSGCKDHAGFVKALNSIDSEVAAGGGAAAVAAPSDSAPIARYNKAIVYYHRHMYRTAIETLMPLVDQLDTLEELWAALAATLMLRLLLTTNQLRKAAAFLDMLQSSERKRPFGLTLDMLMVDDAMHSESMPSDMEGFQRAFKLLALHTCVVNRKLIAVPDDGTVEFGALKAHQYYIMKDFQMAAKQLKKINESCAASVGIDGDVLNTCVANNMGVIHLRVRHYAIAAKFFQDAIVFDKRIAANMRDISLYHMSKAHSCEILYNLGISMLHLRRPKEAFQCFLVPLKSYHSNPRLWFRISEACIMDHEIKTVEEEKKPMVTSVVNAAGRKMFFLKPTPLVLYPRNQSAATSEPNMEFAALALRNALTLTTYYRSTFEQPKEESDSAAEALNWKGVKDNNFCHPSRPTTMAALDNMLSAIYAAYSYVLLRLGDYVQALEMAQELLKSERLSDAHRLLGHMYAGEALIMMDKLPEAHPHLEPTYVTSLNAFDFETKDWRVKSLDAAQNVVRYNLAAAMALQGDYELSTNLCNSCTHPIVAAKVMSLKTYLDIKMGKCT